ncbi:hypothetical protein MPSEU_000384200 [Mayamaea pseudoterrestris]|nr:hypothetical protein MPSEU_000384200 [Mayamaea pseudoterrestris]
MDEQSVQRLVSQLAAENEQVHLDASCEPVNISSQSLWERDNAAVTVSSAETSTKAASTSESYSCSDAAIADALSCSLANIAGNMREQKLKDQEVIDNAFSSSNNDGSSSCDMEQNASVVAVTGSITTSTSDSNHHDDASSLNVQQVAKWPEASSHRHRAHGATGSRSFRKSRADRAAEHVSSNTHHHHAVVASLSNEPCLEFDVYSGGSDFRREIKELVEPGKEPALETIRMTMQRIMQAKRTSSTTTTTDRHRKQHSKPLNSVTVKTSVCASMQDSSQVQQKSMATTSKRLSTASTDNGSSSGSGTEGGYAGSASANDEDNNGGSCSSSDDSLRKSKKARHLSNVKDATTRSTSDPKRPMLLAKKQDSGVSSDIADFGSSSSDNEMTESFMAAFAPSPPTSRSPSVSSEDEAFAYAAPWPPVPLQVSDPSLQFQVAAVTDNNVLSSKSSSNGLMDGKSPLLCVGGDIMAHVLTFLEPPNILEVLTMPLSKDWLFSFTRQPELWRVLCLLEPFKAQVHGNGNDSSDDSDLSANVETELRVTFGKHRLLYTSFVRCMKYLTRIKDDAVNGRPPSVIDYGSGPATFKNIETNQNLKEFLARARGIAVSDNSLSDHDQQLLQVEGMNKIARRRSKASHKAHHRSLDHDANGDACDQIVMHSRKRRRNDADKTSKKKKKVTYGHSMLTQRMLGPTMDGTAGTAVELPWSCAIYSIVNWMVAFSDVEGIQTMCMKVLPSLLDDEQQRITAQRAGLTDIIFRAMVMFPDSSELHTAACHTIVLLARPLGGREGMLFHTSMVNASGIFSIENGGAESGRNGIAVLLDSMRRFRDNGALQAMSCWSLVNVALAPAQKEMLVRLGAIEVTAAAMQTHPFNAEVQFRAIFALVNLVIPSVSLDQDEGTERENSSAEDSSERDILDENVGMIVQLVVQSMKNFCASEAILNRACLVLHNLSLTQDYHNDLLWTPNCYQMLEWCLANYPTDQVLQQSAAGTLHRLQETLSGDEGLKARFMASLQSQQQLSLEQAHREAGALHTQVTATANLSQ